MTSGHPPTPQPPGDQAGHPDLESLADLDAGLTDPATAALLTEHVGSCPTCTAVLGALGTVRADLRALPAPRMPDSVAARLDTTLARLRADAVEQSGFPPDSGTPPPPATRPAADDADAASDLAAARDRRRDRTRRLTTLVAASAVVLAALVGIGTAVLQHGGGGDKSKVTAGAAVPPDQASPRGRSQGSAPPRGRTEGGQGTEGPGVAAVPAVVPSYDRTTLAAALPTIEQQSTIGVVTAAGTQGPGGAMADAGRRTRCADSIPNAPGTLTAVRRVWFERTPGYLFVYADAAHGRAAVVVGADCGLVSGQPTVLYRLPA